MWPFKKLYIWDDPFCLKIKPGLLIIVARSKNAAIKKLRKKVTWKGYKRNISKEDLIEVGNDICYLRSIQGNTDIIG